jgi:soluble lytic murein transglycosylase-like protein
MTTGYRTEIVTAARAHGLDADLVEGIVLQESSGRTYAYRFEPNFWAKYMATKPAFAQANPERVSASYGLMQVMFCRRPGSRLHLIGP